MPEFITLLPPDDARKVLLDNIQSSPDGEWIETFQALGRVTYQEIVAPHPLPSFARSTVDGYVVRAEDTFGVSESMPGYLTVVAEILMGTQPEFTLGPGQCALIHTGGMLPGASNAVIMVEYTQAVNTDEIEILRPVADGENIIHPGEDVKTGEVIIPSGVMVRPQEIGGLAALGILNILVNRKPRVAILSTGDEIVPPSREIKPGQVRDINTYTLQALVGNEGALAVPYGILPDNLDALESTAQKALQECDLLVITAGSSASTRDLTAVAINRLGKPGVLVHGVNIRPGKPAILAVCKQGDSQVPKAVIGLPGNPVSALVIAQLFVIPVIRKLLGLTPTPLQPTLTARISTNLPSQTGREDWVPVRIKKIHQEFIAEPVFGKSNLIFTLSRADGLVRIHPDANGIPAGSTVQVMLI